MKNFDKQYLNDKVKLLAGVDEAGRGPLAGPVVAAAVILPKDFYDEKINDSKKLSQSEREELFPIIKSNAIAYTYSIVNHSQIDEINILKASLLAMKNSVKKLKVQPHLVLVDGNKIFNYSCPVLSIIKGDSKSQSIAAASIIAKVVRDRIMVKHSKIYPDYGWEKNKGYPTREHIKALINFGSTPLHRKTFLKNIGVWQRQLNLELKD
jgi:ribonuclease HII